MNKIQLAITKMLLSNDPARIADACAVQCLKAIETTRVSTAATDGVVLLYNPTYVEGLNVDEVCGLLVHEVCHVRFSHHDQFSESGYVNHRHANVAMDMEINPLVLRAGYELPAGGCFPDDIGQPSGKSWQAYYAAMQQAEESKSEEQGDEAKSDEANGDAGQDSEAKGEEGQSEPANESGEGQGSEAGQGDESGAAGQPGAESGVEDGLHAPGSLTEEFAPELLDEERDAEKAAEEVAAAIEDASEQSRVEAPAGTGKKHSKTGTGTKQLVAKGVIETDGRWQDVVIELVASRAAGESTVDWSRPSRRNAGSSFYRPSRRKVSGFRLALLVDVSGSCTRWFDTWQAMARELVEAVKEITELEIIYHDTEITKRDSWVRRNGEEVTIESRGGGGTCFKAAIAAAAAEDVDGIVLFTDGEGDWPADPGIDCVTVQPPGRFDASPYGSTVRISRAS